MLVKEALLKDNNIEKVLSFYGYANITDRGKEVRCGFSIETNPSSITVYKNENLTAIDFTGNLTGDIFTILMEHKGLSYSEIIRDIKNLLDIKITYSEKKENESVTRVFDDILFKKKEELQVYKEEVLDKYADKWNIRFFKDGISIDTQKKFGLRYDYEEERIVIPHRTLDGELCGIIGRINLDEGYGSKYLPLISHIEGDKVVRYNHRKSQTLYGYSQNYKDLYGADVIYVGESEKFVMQLDSMGYHNSLSLSGSNISKEQCLAIAKLNPKKVVLCFDEGLEEVVMYRCANQLSITLSRMNIEVGLIIDRENKYLERGSKDSPTDKGKEVWESLIQNCYERN